VQVQLDAKTVSMQLGNQGVDVKISDNRGRQLGTLRIGQATVEWRKGKIGPRNAKKVELSKFISEHLDSMGMAKPAGTKPRKRSVRPAKPAKARVTAKRRTRPATATKPSAGRAATAQRKRPVSPAKPSSPRATAKRQRRGARKPAQSKTRR
jgi:hypothetical protein